MEFEDKFTKCKVLLFIKTNSGTVDSLNAEEDKSSSMRFFGMLNGQARLGSFKHIFCVRFTGIMYLQ